MDYRDNRHSPLKGVLFARLKGGPFGRRLTAQRLLDRTGAAASLAIIEEFKRISGKHSISMVFFGLGSVTSLFDHDPQLADRWNAERRIEPFCCAVAVKAEVDGQATVSLQPDEPQFLEWRRLLASIQQHTGLPTSSPMGGKDMAFRLFFASSGVLRRLRQLLIESTRIWSHGDKEHIDFAILSEGYARSSRFGMKGVDPFTADFPKGQKIPEIVNDYEINQDATKRTRRGRADASRLSSEQVKVAGAITKALGAS